ncbi:hypothetical protein KFE25_011344 [Diacronema lutheri]|uniref:Uncharacterized protein n=1 Tax=Diacronema lutheri TaxID=2081491 RepID=A0A8J6C4W5_DIALT|nr:hypothetical protein KFE25_011344 [Diacronema lutheri]
MRPSPDGASAAYVDFGASAPPLSRTMLARLDGQSRASPRAALTPPTARGLANGTDTRLARGASDAGASGPLSSAVDETEYMGELWEACRAEHLGRCRLSGAFNAWRLRRAPSPPAPPAPRARPPRAGAAAGDGASRASIGALVAASPPSSRSASSLSERSGVAPNSRTPADGLADVRRVLRGIDELRERVRSLPLAKNSYTLRRLSAALALADEEVRRAAALRATPPGASTPPRACDTPPLLAACALQRDNLQQLLIAAAERNAAFRARRTTYAGARGASARPPNLAMPGAGSAGATTNARPVRALGCGRLARGVVRVCAALLALPLALARAALFASVAAPACAAAAALRAVGRLRPLPPPPPPPPPRPPSPPRAPPLGPSLANALPAHARLPTAADGWLAALVCAGLHSPSEGAAQRAGATPPPSKSADETRAHTPETAADGAGAVADEASRRACAPPRPSFVGTPAPPHAPLVRLAAEPPACSCAPTPARARDWARPRADASAPCGGSASMRPRHELGTPRPACAARALRWHVALPFGLGDVGATWSLPAPQL